MATEKLVQNSFVNGQYDREVQSKERSDFIGQGLAKALNVVSGEKGELRKRLGTKHLLDLSRPTVLIPFRLPDENDAIIAINSDSSDNVKGYRYIDGKLQPLLSVTSEATVTFPGKSSWPNGNVSDTSITSGDWTVSASFLNNSGSSNYPGYLLNSEQRADGSYMKIGGYVVNNNANASQYIAIDNSNTDVCMQEIKIWFWTRRGGSGYQYLYWTKPTIQYSDDGNTWIGVQTDYTVGQYTQVSYYAPGHGIPAQYTSKCLMTISQDKYSQNHRYWRVYFASGSVPTAVFIGSVSFVNVATSSPFEETVAYTEDKLKKLKYAQDSNELFIACDGVIPYRLQNNTGVLTFGAFNPANTPTLWSTIGGYPTSVALFQNRLWFGGFENNPQTVIASKFGDYETFTTSPTTSTIQYDDYLNLRCNQLKTRISNIIGGQKVLYSFSEDGLALVDSGASGMIATNQSVEFNLRNRMPAGNSTPAFKDDIMLYGSSDGTKLYAVDYDLITERFQVDDLAKYAKDITFDKITELHYVNDESKLIYGLLESGNMFALNYMKGVYQGFFPITIQDGFIYDIVQIKVGRNYKLLIVAYRNGSWFIEEMPDKGNYIDTIAPFMTKEDKKWATYDNINNNIALDCWQKYEDTIELTATLDYENLTLTTESDLSAFIGSQVMLGQLNDENQWVVLNIESSESAGVYNITIDSQRGDSYVFDTLYIQFNDLPIKGSLSGMLGVVSPGQYLGEYSVTGENEYLTFCGWVDGNNNYVFTKSATPAAGDQLYDENGKRINKYYQNVVVSYDETNDEITVNDTSETSIQFSRDQDADYVYGSIIQLPKPVFKATYGALYDAYAFIKIERPYESMKTVRQINLEVQNTMHLSVGTSLDDMQVLEDINDNTHYDLTNMTMNGGYVIVPGDTPEWSKFIIMKSDKGLPFTVNAVEVIINYSNEGGN